MAKDILLSKEDSPRKVIEIHEGTQNYCMRNNIMCGNDKCCFLVHNLINACKKTRPRPCVRKMFGEVHWFYFEEA